MAGIHPILEQVNLLREIRDLLKEASEDRQESRRNRDDIYNRAVEIMNNPSALASLGSSVIGDMMPIGEIVTVSGESAPLDLLRAVHHLLNGAQHMLTRIDGDTLTEAERDSVFKIKSAIDEAIAEASGLLTLPKV